MPNPPQHRADAPIVFVVSNDPAWDHDRFNTEIKQGDAKARASHPVGMYVRGETRGDLTAIGGNGCAAEDYLDDYTGIELKRLGIIEVARCRDQSPRVGQLAAARLAYDGNFDALVDEKGAEYVFELGEFALRCSEAPRPGESKRSDS